jgi:hypothetical protein
LDRKILQKYESEPQKQTYSLKQCSPTRR